MQLLFRLFFAQCKRTWWPHKIYSNLGFSLMMIINEQLELDKQNFI